jgi:hypothetical protein
VLTVLIFILQETASTPAHPFLLSGIPAAGFETVSLLTLLHHFVFELSWL